jgi:ATP-dependent helicase/nuclease subunit B
VFDDCVVIVPTKRRIRHLVREVMAWSGRPVTPAFPFFTLGTLMRALYAATDTPLRVAAGPLQTLLFQSAILRTRAHLEYFSFRAGEERLPAGTFDKVIEVVLHLKESGLVPSVLAAEARSAPLDEQRKLLDIAAIFQAYEEVLQSLGSTDEAGIAAYFARACDTVTFGRVFRSLHPRADLLSLSGFDEFTPLELGFIRQLTAVPGLSVHLLFDYAHGNPALFGHLEENYRQFREMGFAPLPEERDRRPSLFPVNTLSRSEAAHAAGEFLAQSLFLLDRPAAKADLAASVTLLRAPGRKAEVEAICRTIRQLADEDPSFDPASVCVAMRQPRLYTELFRQQADRFGIPVNITDRFHLSRSPLVIMILALLRLPSAGFRRDDVLRVAGAPYFSFDAGRGGVEVGILASVSARLRITAGPHAWREKIARERAKLRTRMETPADPREAASIRSEIALLDSAAGAIETLRELLAPFGAPCVPREFQRRVLEVLRRLKVSSRVVETGAPGSSQVAERDARAYASFLEALDEAVDLAEFEAGLGTLHPTSYYVERLTTAVLRERYNVHEQFGRGVLVTSIDETRGLPTRVMIVAGLVDGEFPTVYQPEVFLSARRRSERERRAVWQNRYLFYQAVTNWTDRLYLTYPEREGETDLVRSAFVEALLAAAHVRQEVAAEPNLPARIVSAEDEVLRWAVVNGPPPEADRSNLPDAFDDALAEVRRAVEVERERAGDGTPGEYGGILGNGLSPAARQLLASLPERSFSVSQLETYRSCPFKFLAGRLLRLNAAVELEEALSPLEKGSVLHEALFEFYLSRRSRHASEIAACSGPEFEQAVEELSAIVRGILDRLEIPDPFWDLDRELLTGGAGVRRGIVREYLESERTREVRSSPRYFEAAFGEVGGNESRRDPLLSSPEPVRLGGIRLRGKIDRIDIGGGFFTVVDYKTGKRIPEMEEILTGRSLQLPLYLAAVRRLFGEAGEEALAPAGGVYYLLRRPVRASVGVASARFNKVAFTASAGSPRLLPDDETLRQLTEKSIAFAEEAVGGMSRGEFPLVDPDAAGEICPSCDYRTMCRIQAARHVHSRSGEGS